MRRFGGENWPKIENLLIFVKICWFFIEIGRFSSKLSILVEIRWKPTTYLLPDPAPIGSSWSRTASPQMPPSHLLIPPDNYSQDLSRRYHPSFAFRIPFFCPKAKISSTQIAQQLLTSRMAPEVLADQWKRGCKRHKAFASDRLTCRRATANRKGLMRSRKCKAVNGRASKTGNLTSTKADGQNESFLMLLF